MYFEVFQLIMASLLLLYFISRKYKYTLYASAYYLIISICCIWDTWKAQDISFEASTYKTILTIHINKRLIISENSYEYITKNQQQTIKIQPTKIQAIPH